MKTLLEMYLSMSDTVILNNIQFDSAQSAGAVEYTDCIYAEW